MPAGARTATPVMKLPSNRLKAGRRVVIVVRATSMSVMRICPAGASSQTLGSLALPALSGGRLSSRRQVGTRIGCVRWRRVCLIREPAMS